MARSRMPAMTPTSAATTRMKTMIPAIRKSRARTVSLSTLPLLLPRRGHGSTARRFGSTARWVAQLGLGVWCGAGWYTGDFGAVRHVLGDNRACAGGSLAADANRGDEHRVAADEGAVLNYRLVLGLAIVVAGDSAGTDIHVCADLRVPDIAE